MSLDGFYVGLARLVGDPDLVVATRRGDHVWLDGVDVTADERGRLVTMAADPGMAAMCSLYRSNRLTSLVRTVPSLVEDLGDRLSDTVTDFWRQHARTDLQFRSEAVAFCEFVRDRHGGDRAMLAAVDRAEASLVERYG